MILKTNNGGTTWIEIGNEIYGVLKCIYFIDANSGYAVGMNGTILKTFNGGTTWLFQSEWNI